MLASHTLIFCHQQRFDPQSLRPMMRGLHALGWYCLFSPLAGSERGSTWALTISSQPVIGHHRRADILAVANQEQYAALRDYLNEHAIVLFDQNDPIRADSIEHGNALALPLQRALQENKLHPDQWTAALSGAVWACLDLDPKYWRKDALPESWSEAAQIGFGSADEHAVRIHLPAPNRKAAGYIISADEAIVSAAIGSGTKMMATGGVNTEDYGSVLSDLLPACETQNCADPLNAVWVAAGAAVAGVRSLAVIPADALSSVAPAIAYCAGAEVPMVVVVDAGRAASKQPLGIREYRYAVEAYGAPVIQLYPADVTQAFRLVQEATNFAEQLQTPVLVHVGDVLSRSVSTCPPAISEPAVIDRGQLLRGRQTGGREYDRYAPSSTGISPRKLPGQPGAPFVTGSDWSRPALSKREHKISSARFPVPYLLHGPKDAAATIIAHGDLTASSRQAAIELSAGGLPTNVLQLHVLRPLPADQLRLYFRQGKHLFVAEQSPGPGMVSVLADGTGHRLIHPIPLADSLCPADVLKRYISDTINHF